MTIFERTKMLAKKRGLSLQDLALKAGLGVNSIYTWKKTDPTITRLSSVAKVLDVSIDDLLGADDNSKNKKSKLDLEVDEAVNSIRFFQNKQITEDQHAAMRGMLRGYLETLDKEEEEEEEKKNQD